MAKWTGGVAGVFGGGRPDVGRESLLRVWCRAAVHVGPAGVVCMIVCAKCCSISGLFDENAVWNIQLISSILSN